MKHGNTTRPVQKWVLPRRLWRIVKRELPPHRGSGTPGRPSVPHRVVLNAIWFVLWTGCQWDAVQVAQFGVSKSTAHARLRQWQQQGIWRRIWQRLLRRAARQRGIPWHWQAIDSKAVPAPLGGAQTGPNPTDRGKRGVKIHLLVAADGTPISVVVTGAHRHDKTQVVPVIEAVVVRRPRQPQHLCADRGYDYDDVPPALQARGYTPHLRHRRRRGEAAAEPAAVPGALRYPARRWVVERTLAWLGKPRALRTCWAKTLDTWLALITLGCCHILCNLIFFG